MKIKFILILIIVFSCSTSAKNNWHFVFEPYISLSNISGDAKVGRTQNAELNLDFSTILENLEMAKKMGWITFWIHSDYLRGTNYKYIDMSFSDIKDCLTYLETKS